MRVSVYVCVSVCHSQYFRPLILSDNTNAKRYYNNDETMSIHKKMLSKPTILLINQKLISQLTNHIAVAFVFMANIQAISSMTILIHVQ